MCVRVCALVCVHVSVCATAGRCVVMGEGVPLPIQGASR